MSHTPMPNPLEPGEWLLTYDDIELVFRRMNISEPKPLTSMAQARLFLALCEQMWS